MTILISVGSIFDKKSKITLQTSSYLNLKGDFAEIFTEGIWML